MDDARRPFARETDCYIVDKVRARRSGLVASSTTKKGIRCIIRY